MTKKELMIKAHKMTKEIKNEFPEIDYKFQLGLCISYLQEKEIDVKINVNDNVYEYLTDVEIKSFVNNLNLNSLKIDDFNFVNYEDCYLCIFPWFNIYNELIININV